MLEIQSPVHGAVLNANHGHLDDNGLQVRVEGTAPARSRVTVNGDDARIEGTRFQADITLTERQNDVVARSESGAGTTEHQVRVVWDKGSFKRYRFSIDDNSFFLRDIAKEQYGSLFDCFYLDALRTLNREYGARFVLNIYYTTDDGFDLTQFPERYRSEWKDNADWLRLAFHAHANDPDRPYQYASATRIIEDWDRVEEQIVRFAGESVCSPPTVIHWAMVHPDTYNALYERGIRVLSGYFNERAGKRDINYQLDEARSEYLSRHDALLHVESGITFARVDIICNNTPVERIVPTLEPLAADPNHAEIMDLFTHEQFFWPFYRNHLPDHAQRLDTAIRWVTDHGYQPVFYHEGFLGNTR
jgi:hypothetical protein